MKNFPQTYQREITVVKIINFCLMPVIASAKIETIPNFLAILRNNLVLGFLRGLTNDPRNGTIIVN
jgi:hypothetical protein